MQSNVRPGNLRPVSTAQVLFVVADDEVIRSALTFILRDHYETHAYASLDQLGAGAAAHTPDLILLGDGLADGPTPTRQDLADLAQTKLLLLANTIGRAATTPDPDGAAHCAPFGRRADGILRKPITVDNVRDTVAALLGDTHA
jgi:CheY-like chemotaxis protein